MMQTPPPGSKDAEHLKILAVFHYVVAGLALAGIGFLCLHFLILKAVFSDGALGRNNPAPPPEFLAIFKWFYLVVGLFLIAGSILNFLSASFMRKRKHRMFSLVVAGLNCLQIPLGTVLGVFTILVLSRESVRQSYETCGLRPAIDAGVPK